VPIIAAAVVTRTTYVVRTCSADMAWSFKVVGPDLRDLGLVVDRVRATRQRAAWAPVAERRWTTQGPPAADNAPPPDLTLDDRLDLLDHQAALHEEWQR